MKCLDTLVVNHKPINEVVLKRLLLVFDHIYLLHPKENNFLIPDEVARLKYSNMEIVCGDYGILYNSEKYQELESRLIDSFDYALHKGVLRVLDLKASKFYNKYWFPLRLTYDFDTANPQLLNLAKNLCEQDLEASPPNGVLRGMFVQPSGVQIYPTIPAVPDIFNQEEKQKYQFELQAFSSIGKLNRALAVCGAFNLIPSFIDRTIGEMFVKKCELAKNNSEYELNSVFEATNKISLQKVQYLLFKMSEQILPNEILSEIPLKELIIARNNTFHELYKLRRKLLESIEFLSKHEFDLNFFNEVEQYISKELEPQIQDYYSKFLTAMLNFLKYETTFTFGVIGATIGLSQSLSPMEVAFLSGISATAGTAVNNLADFVTNKGKNKFKNSYSYFLNFRS